MVLMTFLQMLLSPCSSKTNCACWESDVRPQRSRSSTIAKNVCASSITFAHKAQRKHFIAIVRPEEEIDETPKDHQEDPISQPHKPSSPPPVDRNLPPSPNPQPDSSPNPQENEDREFFV